MNYKSHRKTSVKQFLFFLVFIIGITLTVSFAGQQQSYVQKAQTPACIATLSAKDQNQIDTTVQGVMSKDSLPAISIAITKDGRLVFAKAYGVADKNTNEPVTTSTRFRIASVTKSFTSAGILKLVETGKINLDQKVFGPGSILGTTYTANPKDPRINTITVRQLLSHTSGVWSSDTGDPLDQNASMNKAQIISSALQTMTLPNAPGSKYDYSNFGYLILGRIIEKVTGQSYEPWMRANVMAPVGITDMQIAGSKLADRASNEVVYYSQLGADPYVGILMDAMGSWIATPTDLARFMVHMDSFTPPADFLTTGSLQMATTPTSLSLTALGNGAGYGLGWYANSSAGSYWHIGALPGTRSEMVRTANGYTFAVVTNSDGQTVGADIENMMFDAVKGITAWPTCDLFFPIPTSVPNNTNVPSEVPPTVEASPTFTTIGDCQSNGNCPPTQPIAPSREPITEPPTNTNPSNAPLPIVNSDNNGGLLGILLQLIGLLFQLLLSGGHGGGHGHHH